MNESENWIVLFFKERITLKHWKIIRSSEPRSAFEKRRSVLDIPTTMSIYEFNLCSIEYLFSGYWVVIRPIKSKRAINEVVICGKVYWWIVPRKNLLNNFISFVFPFIKMYWQLDCNLYRRPSTKLSLKFNLESGH